YRYDYYEDYYDYEYGDDEEDPYDWRKRNDPCNRAYYDRDRFLQANLLVSDLGVVVKSANDGSLSVFVNGIRDLTPRQGAEVNIFDYQGNLLESSQTNATGELKIQLKR